VLREEVVNDTLGALLKYQDDVRRVRGPVANRIAGNAARP
jgi:hypothetical protein